VTQETKNRRGDVRVDDAVSIICQALRGGMYSLHQSYRKAVWCQYVETRVESACLLRSKLNNEKEF